MTITETIYNSLWVDGNGFSCESVVSCKTFTGNEAEEMLEYALNEFSFDWYQQDWLNYNIDFDKEDCLIRVEYARIIDGEEEVFASFEKWESEMHD